MKYVAPKLIIYPKTCKTIKAYSNKLKINQNRML